MKKSKNRRKRMPVVPRGRKKLVLQRCFCLRLRFVWPVPLPPFHY